jgi:peptidoglycan/xylan/chitin deacetylase (PgdA/CDA1 family)
VRPGYAVNVKGLSRQFFQVAYQRGSGLGDFGCSPARSWNAQRGIILGIALVVDTRGPAGSHTDVDAAIRPTSRCSMRAARLITRMSRAGAAALPAAAAASVALYELPALAFALPMLRPRFGIVDRLGTGDVALTFDDGPHRHGTPAVLHALADEGVSATFFLVGEQVLRDPGLAAEIVAAGHEVGLHCHRHRLLSRLGPREVFDDLRVAAGAIESATGRRPVLYRPPYGVFNLTALRAAHRRGWQPTLWTRWGRDWERRATPGSIVANLCRGLGPGDILLLHDADHYAAAGSWRKTVAALPCLLDALREQGLQPVALTGPSPPAVSGQAAV